MASESIVINTGPLILLEKADALDLVARLPFQFFAPLAVRAELDAGETRGFLSPSLPWVTFVPLQSPLSPISQALLDVGEAQVIQLALERKIGRVCLDDLRGRRIAVASGLQVTGVLGLLGLAKTLGLIPAIKPYCDRLMQAGAWYSTAVIRQALKDFGE